jgi:beta-lactamase superfamily II metal-dependent hydrolase
MKVKGVMLDVGDGDAIVLELEKKNQKLLVVIDGGDTGCATSVCNFVKSKCESLQKEAPDLVICTHYDSDHIAGVIRIVDHFRDKIGMIWVHKPPSIIRESFDDVRQILTENWLQLSGEAKLLHSLGLQRNDPKQVFRHVLLESIKQLSDLMQLIEGFKIPHEEPFAGECFYPGWTDLKILGPTRQFFNEIFQNKTREQIFAKEYSTILNEEEGTSHQHKPNPYNRLKADPKTSATNLSSVILKIDAGKDTLLFTGDAGVESFLKVLDFENSIQNMTFLKIPHHASKNNINKNLITTIDPEYAYNSGDKYEDVDVMDCLKAKKERQVRSTKTDGNLNFSFGT